jgi:hypothetical protein
MTTTKWSEFPGKASHSLFELELRSDVNVAQQMLNATLVRVVKL